MSEQDEKMYGKKILRDLLFMYPAVKKPGYWTNPDGDMQIRKMSKQHIINVIDMLRARGEVSLNHLQRISEVCNNEFINEAKELLENKISEFEEHLENGEYEKYR